MNGSHRHRAAADNQDQRAAWQGGYRRKAPRAKVSRNPQGRMRLSASRCGDALLTFFGVAKVERLHEEFRRRVRLAVSGQIKLRRIDGWRKIAAVLAQHTPVAA